MGIEIVGVTKRFGSVTAVRQFSLRTEPGELIAIVGPSGCGKTTLLRVIAGLEQADEGAVRIGGKDATHLPPERRNVGFVFQQFALFPNMNVADNIGYGLRRRRVPRGERERRVAELLAMIGMEAYGGRRPAQLSAGQQQRVALARSLAPQPSTLLLDEPLSALDAAIRYELRDELRRVQRRVGITTILVTHDQEEALAIADRVVVMNEGRLEQVGPPWELYDEPRTNFVARFIGRGNFLPGERRPDGIWLAGLGLWPHAGLPAGTPDLEPTRRANTRDGASKKPATQAATSDAAPGKPAPARSKPASAPSQSASEADHGDKGELVTVLVRPESLVVEPQGMADWASAASIAGDGERTATAAKVERTRGAVQHKDAAGVGRGSSFVLRAVVEDIVFGGERAHIALRPVGDSAADDEAGEPARAAGNASQQLLAAVPSGDVPAVSGHRGRSVTVIIPYEALRLLPN